MARTTKKKDAAAPVVTRAEKKDAVKNLIKELLAVKPHRHNELLDEAAKLYAERLGGEDTANVNDVKGRIGSVLDVMKKDGDVGYEGGVYALKARLSMSAPQATTEEKTEEKPKKTRAKKAVKTQETPVEKPKEEKVEKPKKTRAKKQTKTEKEAETKAEVSQAATEKPAEEKPAPKKRGRKPKTAEVKAEEPLAPQTETVKEEPFAPKIELPKAEKREEKAESPQAPQPQTQPQENALVVKEKGEVAKKDVMDVSFLLGATPKTPAKPAAQTEKQAEKQAEKPSVKESAATPKTEENKEPKTQENLPTAQPAAQSAPKAQPQTASSQPQPAKKDPAPVKRQTERKGATVRVAARAEKPLTADEKLRESFLKKLRSLGGDYFEYYSIYLLERYSMKNGRRLESLKISGGDHDGGIDGELELTDSLGFKETLYVQSKNWNPEKGDEKLWVVGETLLQQFIGACACRQAKDGKQCSRGVFITTSRFTPEARRILDVMQEKIIGYDGNDLYEAAKECAFGLVKKNGEWALDEKLLSGTKAFFHMY